MTTSTLQAEIDGLRAKQKEADAETAKHNAQENKAKTEHEDAEAFAESEKKRIEADEQVGIRLQINPALCFTSNRISSNLSLYSRICLDTHTFSAHLAPCRPKRQQPRRNRMHLRPRSEQQSKRLQMLSFKQQTFRSVYFFFLFTSFRQCKYVLPAASLPSLSSCGQFTFSRTHIRRCTCIALHTARDNFPLRFIYNMKPRPCLLALVLVDGGNTNGSGNPNYGR